MGNQNKSFASFDRFYFLFHQRFAFGDLGSPVLGCVLTPHLSRNLPLIVLIFNLKKNWHIDQNTFNNSIIMPTIEETLTQLQEMGFSQEKAKKALMMTGWKGVEPAMEWILAHPVDDGTLDEEEEEEMKLAEEEAKKPKKELTPEEREEQMKRLEELRVKKAKERIEQEKKDAIEKEKRRVALIKEIKNQVEGMNLVQ